eukprot:764937-Hanusia_phi.AAC.2
MTLCKWSRRGVKVGDGGQGRKKTAESDSLTLSPSDRSCSVWRLTGISDKGGIDRGIPGLVSKAADDILSGGSRGQLCVLFSRSYFKLAILLLSILTCLDKCSGVNPAQFHPVRSFTGGRESMGKNSVKIGGEERSDGSEVLGIGRRIFLVRGAECWRRERRFPDAVHARWHAAGERS